MITRCWGADGKTYPARALTPEDRLRLIGRVHYLSHAENLSVRKIVARLDAEGVTRSVGSVSEYLTRYQCSRCSGVQNEPPEHSEEER